MPRQVRIEYEGAFYHVMARGNRRNPIFVSSDGGAEDLFLDTLGQCCGPTGFRVWAWVLMMGNHYHLLQETPLANLVEGMEWFTREGTSEGCPEMGERKLMTCCLLFGIRFLPPNP